MMVDLGMLPTKGIACPFLSFGGTSMLMTLATLGLLQRIHLEVSADESSRGRWASATAARAEGDEA
jgi:cell division protein FtsW